MHAMQDGPGGLWLSSGLLRRERPKVAAGLAETRPEAIDGATALRLNVP